MTCAENGPGSNADSATGGGKDLLVAPLDPHELSETLMRLLEVEAGLLLDESLFD